MYGQNMAIKWMPGHLHSQCVPLALFELETEVLTECQTTLPLETKPSLNAQQEIIAAMPIARQRGAATQPQTDSNFKTLGQAALSRQVQRHPPLPQRRLHPHPQPRPQALLRAHSRPHPHPHPHPRPTPRLPFVR